MELTAGEPALDNDRVIAGAARALTREAGMEVAPAWRSCGSDDFSFFSEIAPIAMGFAGLKGAPGFEQRPLHHPEFLPPDDAVGSVARAQAILFLAAVEAAGAAAAVEAAGAAAAAKAAEAAGAARKPRRPGGPRKG